ncbi:glycosyltransferase family 4 protein [Nocardia takedensis]
MKVCLLTSAFHPRVGGAETYAKVLAAGLVDRGHEVVVITDGHEIPPHTALPGIDVRRIDTSAALFEAGTRVLWEQMAFGLLPDLDAASEGADLVHANSHDTAILAAMIGASRGIPVVATFHDQAPEDGPLGVGRSRLVYRHLPIDAFLVPSRFYADKARTFGADPARVELVYLGIDPRRFDDGDRREARRGLGLTESGSLTVCAATLKPRKGLRQLIAAFAAVHREHEDARLLIAGAAELTTRDYADAVRADIAAHGLGEVVRIEEGFTHDDMPTVFRAADIVVQPSLAEGLGLALLEGMATGRPVVGTDITGINEIIEHEVNGLVVAPDDPADLATALTRLLSDSGLAAKLAAAGCATARTAFTRDRMIEETIARYERVVGACR